MMRPNKSDIPPRSITSRIHVLRFVRIPGAFPPAPCLTGQDGAENLPNGARLCQPVQMKPEFRPSLSAIFMRQPSSLVVTGQHSAWFQLPPPPPFRSGHFLEMPYLWGLANELEAAIEQFAAFAEDLKNRRALIFYDSPLLFSCSRFMTGQAICQANRPTRLPTSNGSAWSRSFVVFGRFGHSVPGTWGCKIPLKEGAAARINPTAKAVAAVTQCPIAIFCFIAN